MQNETLQSEFCLQNETLQNKELNYIFLINIMDLNLHLFAKLSAELCPDVAGIIIGNLIKCDIKNIHLLARHGYGKLLFIFHANGFRYNLDTFIYAAEANQLDVIKLLQAKYCIINYEKIFNAAMTNNSYDVIEYILANGFKPRYNISREPVFAGDLRTLQILHKYGCELAANIQYISLDNEYYHVMNWLLDIGERLEPNLTCRVVQEGNIEALKYILDHGGKWQRHFYVYGRRHQHMIEWLRENEHIYSK